MEHKSIEGFRLSPQQKRLWLLQRDSVAFRAHCSILIEGELNGSVLKESLYRIMRRHEILRTNFYRPLGMKLPLQVIAEDRVPCLREVSLVGLSLQKQEERLEKLFITESEAGFNFEHDALLKLMLVSLSTRSFVLMITLPSLCADSWTLNKFFEEIGSTYQNCLQDGPPFEETIQYVQFSEFQNELLQAEEGRIYREYWQKKDLSGFSLLSIPFEKKAESSAIFCPERVIFDID
ncbi:MAG: condensation domain-containing protein, partial [Acidobacteriota bacterium]